MFESNLIVNSKSAKIVEFTKHILEKKGKGLNKALIKKRDSINFYLIRDIEALFERNTIYNFDQIIYMVALDQVWYI